MPGWCVPLDGSELPSRAEIGGKAWSLARMRRLGLPCPPAFVLPTRACQDYHASGGELPGQIVEALRLGVSHLEAESGRRFGGSERPLLVSVRSGAPVSMPGMMDTVLNLGFDERVEAALAAEAGDRAYAVDTHRRFVAGYARIVLKTDLEDDSLPPWELRRLVAEQAGRSLPDDPWEQLREAVCAVLDSWQSRRARVYRRYAGIPDDLGTAVTVQAMVFGNLGKDSGTGVLFTRDPLTGGPHPYGEYLPGGQGEDVVSGERTPLPLAQLAARHREVHDELLAAARRLEVAGGDVQDIEFTVERGRLYLLQTRAAKRSPEAAVRLAVDLVDEGLITEAEALTRVTADQARQALHPRLDPEDAARATAVATGEAASPGIGVGIALADADEVARRAARGESVVFLAHTTSPQDVQAMIIATAVCTETGGSTSHAAVVCRGLGRPAVVGCGPGMIERLAGREVTADGGRGTVYAGRLPLVRPDTEGDERVRRLTGWAAAEAGIEVVADAPAEGLVDLDQLGIVDQAGIDGAIKEAIGPGLEAGTGAAIGSAAGTAEIRAATGASAGPGFADAMAVRGKVVETDAGVAAVIRAGVRRIVTAQPLPVLLAAARYRREHSAPHLSGSTSEAGRRGVG